MATMNVSLPDELKAWVEARARGASYANTSDYVRDLVRRDQERQQAIDEIQAGIDAARASGPPAPFDVETFLAEQRTKHGG